MNPVDTKNFDLIEKYIKQYGFKEESEQYALAEMRNPTMDEEFKRHIGNSEDFRKRWPLNNNKAVAVSAGMDKGWGMFQTYFNHYPTMGIEYNDYKTNKKTVGKNLVKIKKVMTDFYMANPTYFVRDARYLDGFTDRNKIVDVADTKSNKPIIEDYIVKAFEKIGTCKSPNSDLELVLSCNFADWLLCSTKEDWSSCLCIDGGAYWTGLPLLIGDKNRAFMYVTNGKKKIWHDIEVDSVICRSWVLLTKKNEKKLVKFYPQQIVDDTLIRAITGDAGFTFSPMDRVSKNEIRPILFKKADIWTTIYNDGCGLHEEKFKREGKLFWDYNRGRTSDTVSLTSKSKDGISFRSFSSKLHDYLESNKFINDRYSANVCPCCGKVVTGDNSVGVADSNDRYCRECAAIHLTKCDKCGNWELKAQTGIYTIDGKPKKLCHVCKDTTYLCVSCGDRHYKENSHTISENRLVCNKCHSAGKTVKCPECDEEYLTKEMVSHGEEIVCNACFKKKKYAGYGVCVECRKSFAEHELLYSNNGEGSCDPCLTKLSGNNSKQFRFSFYS